MKKIYFLVLILTLYACNLLAQSLQLQTLSGEIIKNGSTVGLIWPMNSDTTTNVYIEINIKNISSSSVNVKALKVIKTLPAGQGASYCFAGGCFTDTTTVSPTILSLTAGETAEDFSAHIIPNNSTGSSIVYYKFYSTQNMNDTVSVYIQTEIWHLGINNLANSKAEIGLVYPNPANQRFTAEYSLTSELNARMVLQNILGSIIREEPIANGKGKIQMDVAGLPEGIYFFSLYLNDKSVSSRKLLIRH